MKKAVIVIVLLAILAGAAYYISKSFAASDPAKYLPSTTLAYLILPDLPRSSGRWQETELAKIAAEPAVREFLQTPLAQLGRIGKNEADAILGDLKPVRIFWAATSFQPANVCWATGFQYFGSNQSLEKAIDRLRTQLDGAQQPQQKSNVLYNGVEITKSAHGNLNLFTAHQGRWAFLANDEATLHEILDRLSGRNTTPSLLENANFQKGLAQLPKEPDFSAYIDVRSFLNTLLEIGASLKAIPNLQQLDQIKKYHFVSASFKMDGPLMRDSLYAQVDDASGIAKLDHKTMRYTSPDTLLYYSSGAKWPNVKDLEMPFLPPDLHQILAAKQLDDIPLSNVMAPEFGFMLSWPQGNFRPEFLFTIPLQNPETAKNLIEAVSASTFPQMTITDDSSARYYSYPSVKNPLLNPTIAVTKDFLLFGFGESEVHKAATMSGPSATLENSQDFSSVYSVYRNATEAFGYLNTKLAFERTYNALKPVLTFGAAMLPGASQYINTSTLPETSLISNHLSPITFYQREAPDGLYMESAGPLTITQLAAACGGAWWQFFPHQ